MKKSSSLKNFKNLNEAINNATPADIYFGRKDKILNERQKTKKLTLS